MDGLQCGPSPQTDVTEAEIFVFLTTTIQMGHCSETNWHTSRQKWTSFTLYSTATWWDNRHLHVLQFLHFTGSRNRADRIEENYNRPWKIQDIFEILNRTFSKFYNPSENLEDYNHHMGYVDKGDRMANSYSISHQTRKWTQKLFSPSVRSGHSEQLHPLFFMWWEENVTQGFLARPSEEPAGSGWIRASISTGLIHPSWGTLMCALWKAWHKMYMWNVSGVVWPYVSINCALWIITERYNCKTSLYATSIHKFEAWNQNVSKGKWIFTNF
jgi:hypothetical protein